MSMNSGANSCHPSHLTDFRIVFRVGFGLGFRATRLFGLAAGVVPLVFPVGPLSGWRVGVPRLPLSVRLE